MKQLIQKYLYPENLTFAPIEYGWDGYKFVFVVASTDDYNKVTRWYDVALPNALSLDEEDYRIYTFDAGDLHLADAKDTIGLQSFFGSSVLREFANRQKEGVIGVLRFHVFHWDAPPEGPLEGKVFVCE